MLWKQTRRLIPGRFLCPVVLAHSPAQRTRVFMIDKLFVTASARRKRANGGFSPLRCRSGVPASHPDVLRIISGRIRRRHSAAEGGIRPTDSDNKCHTARFHNDNDLLAQSTRKTCVSHPRKVAFGHQTAWLMTTTLSINLIFPPALTVPPPVLTVPPPVLTVPPPFLTVPPPLLTVPPPF